MASSSLQILKAFKIPHCQFLNAKVFDKILVGNSRVFKVSALFIDILYKQHSLSFWRMWKNPVNRKECLVKTDTYNYCTSFAFIRIFWYLLTIQTSPTLLVIKIHILSSMHRSLWFIHVIQTQTCANNSYVIMYPNS